ncbi:ABC transporter permease [Roseomonas sp. BN140053]|uniref:ABC transporter permease n=1 Tax=Roseomonas sp. BN140053 TaxID=3391898 RepID=UPI0039EC97DC
MSMAATAARRWEARSLFAGERLGFWLIALLLLLWEGSVRSGLVNSPNWPAVSAVAAAIPREALGGELLQALAGTLYRACTGFLLGGLAGVALGLLLAVSRVARRTLEPTVELFRPLPIPAMIPPLVLFLGLDDGMKIAVVAFTVFFPVFINTLQGALAIEPTYRGVAATFGVPWTVRVWGVLLPATVPFIFAGLRLSIGLAFVSAVAAEMVAGDAGVGYYLVSTQYAGRGAEMFAAIFMLSFVGYMINMGFVRVERRILFWYHQ